MLHVSDNLSNLISMEHVGIVDHGWHSLGYNRSFETSFDPKDIQKHSKSLELSQTSKATQ